MIACASDALFAKAAAALDAPGLAADPRFATNPRRVENRAELTEELSAVTRELTSADVLERLQRAGVPSAPIHTLDRLAKDAQTEASGMLIPTPHPRLTDFRAIGLPIRWDGERAPVTRVPPRLGEHTAEVLGELGYDAAAIKHLEERHVIGL
jgi:crotonobetainyl-CoA:carnitine CoA-transferase CaiB-like acyl-CoA transferase